MAAVKINPMAGVNVGKDGRSAGFSSSPSPVSLQSVGNRVVCGLFAYYMGKSDTSILSLLLTEE